MILEYIIFSPINKNQLSEFGLSDGIASFTMENRTNFYFRFEKRISRYPQTLWFLHQCIISSAVGGFWVGSSVNFSGFKAGKDTSYYRHKSAQSFNMKQIKLINLKFFRFKKEFSIKIL